MYENFAKPLTQFCENNIYGYIVQPANAWSNMAYVLVGIGLFFLFRRKYHALSNYFAPVSILIGLFSFAYHASDTFAGEFLDLGSMFFLSSYLIVLNLSRLYPSFMKRERKGILFTVLAAGSLMLVYLFRNTEIFNMGDFLFISQILTFLALEWKLHVKHKPPYEVHYLVIALGIFLIAFAIWILDFSNIWCNENYFHIINGHAIWHVMTSISIFFLYLFYRQFDKR